MSRLQGDRIQGQGMQTTENTRHAYHHGDLRKALIEAAEAELAENGVEGFTLRGCAKRAGVSHAAPAHHFKDANALLTALAVVAAERLYDSMESRHGRAEKTPRAQLIASGVGYVEFALANPALFRLLFGSDRPDASDENLHRQSGAAFMVLVSDVAALTGADPMGSDSGQLTIAAAWSLVHGIANLLIANRLDFLKPMLERDFEATMIGLIERIVPA
jgi:AcrR family transcriptional regulator